MALVLTRSQSSTLADFCNDVVKGMLLGVVANQILPSDSPLGIRTVISLAGVIFTVIFLYVALHFSKQEEL
ncbi:hypothetical protein A3J43_03045 [Candidatus Uhrbacteria bacterium RIFCSPHIGHO2_12_FULL_54_23]|uniref:Uncharacterized protein n=2 Tax=Candidatus Uhriibacteriota TaxID=1752732 RepID=A0A1F7UGE1_9BACT|nr:MAG: hypothetical protein A3J43_03045 [Candidatus Uhrbacteria bacterium RIFCSPHIGHO2_12_FULL_54_23]OGL90133.1 MAG: hypothetical protein A3J36_02395 [Candidatus Uhrbacteria bacterium RIFCSPLOWO2_02_FULL_54_37]